MSAALTSSSGGDTIATEIRKLKIASFVPTDSRCDQEVLLIVFGRQPPEKQLQMGRLAEATFCSQKLHQEAIAWSALVDDPRLSRPFSLREVRENLLLKQPETIQSTAAAPKQCRAYDTCDCFDCIACVRKDLNSDYGLL
jgi:hypothetical protein